jgi:tetratricopeptide (TPR) repeat protein
MKTDLTTHAETAYHGFMAIDTGEYREKISFVEKNRIALRELPVLEYAEVMDSYNDALFETGRYHQHLKFADHLIELSIEHNLGSVNGRDLYFETLFQKAASLYNLDRLPEAIYILQELIRINPKHETARLFLINCHVEKHKRKLQVIRTASMVLILCCALIIAVELLIAPALFPQSIPVLEVTRNTMFISGVSVLLVGELWIRYRAVSKVYDFTRGKLDR